MMHQNPVDREVDAANIDAARAAYHVARHRRDTARVTPRGRAGGLPGGARSPTSRPAGRLRPRTASQEIAAHRAKAVRGGGNALADLPAPLRAKRQELRDAADLVQDLEAAQLVADEECAGRRLEAVQRDLAVAARVLFAHEPAEDLDRYEAVMREAELLQRRLSAVTAR